MADAVFTEVLELQLDAQAFRAGLVAVEREYTSFVGRMATMSAGLGSNVLQIGGIGNISTELASLRASLAQFAQAAMSAMGASGQAASGAVAGVAKTTATGQAAVSAAVTSARLNWRGTTQGVVRDLQTVETSAQRVQRVFEEIGRGLSSQTTLRSLDDREATQVFNKLNRVQGRIGQDKTLDLMSPANRKSFLDYQAAISQVGQATSQFYANAAKLGGLSAAEQLKHFNTIKAGGAQLHRTLSADQKAWFTDFKKTQTAIVPHAKTIADQHLGVWQRFTRKLTQNLPELTAQILKYTLGFMLLRSVMQGIASFFGGVVNAFRQGFEFQKVVQDRSQDIKEALLQTVQLSSDWARNIQLAGKAADAASRKILDVAAAAGLIPEKIEAGLKSLIQGGGLRLLNGDLGQSIDLTAKLLSLMRARGVSDSNQRRFVTEINDLMTGQVKETSVLLQVLRFTTSEWKKIREEAAKTGDLINASLPGIESVATRLKAVEQRITTAGERWSELIKAATLYKSVLLGAIAEPLWRSFLGILQTIKREFSEKKNILATMATLIGESVARAFGLADAFTKSETPLTNLLGILLKMVVNLESFADRFTSMFEIAAKAADVLFAKSNANMFGGARKPGETFDSRNPTQRSEAVEKLEAAQAALREARALFTLRGDARDEALLDLARIRAGAPLLGGKKGSGLGDALKLEVEKYLKSLDSGAGENTPRQAMHELTSKFRAELEAVKADFQETYNFLKELEAEGTISQRVLTENTIGYLEQESNAIDKVVGKYKKKATAVEDATDASIRDAQNTFGRVGTKERVANDKTGSSLTQALSRQDENIQLENLKAMEERARAHSRTMLEIFKEEAQAGLHTAVEVFDKEQELAREEYESHVKILMAELEAVGENEKGRTRILNELQLAEQEYTDAVSRSGKTREALVQAEGHRAKQASLDLRQIDIDKMQALLEYDKLHNLSASKVRQREREIAAAALKLAHDNLLLAESHVLAAKAAGVQGKALDELIKQLEAARVATQRAKTDDDSINNKGPRGDTIQKIFGGDRENVRTLKEAFDGFDNTVQSLDAAFKFFGDVVGGFVNAWQQGKEQGGTLGAIGGVLGQAAALDPEPISKAILSIGSQVFGFIGGIFKRAAKKMADQIRASIKESLDAYKAGSVNLIDTIGKLEQQRVSAISRLSSKKGGKDELKKILPDLDAQIADLKKQAKEINEAFNEALDVLRLQSDPLGNLLKSWRELNKQVKEYIGAGGDAAKAAEFLSLSLQKIREDNLATLESGEKEAIDDMLQLNDLLKQRIELVNQFKKDEFDLINSDAIERQAAPAVRSGLELAKKRAEFQEKLTQLDSEISLTTVRVDKEREVFTIASDTAALRARANELELVALDRQIASWKDIQNIIAGITQSSSGLFGLTPSLGVSIGVLNVNNPASGAAVVGEMEAEFQRRGRYGFNKYAEENA